MSKSNVTTAKTTGQELEKYFDVVFEFLCEIAVKLIGFIFKTIGCGIKLFWNNKKSKGIYVLLTLVVAASIFIYISRTGVKRLYVILPILVFLFIIGLSTRIVNFEHSKI